MSPHKTTPPRHHRDTAGTKRSVQHRRHHTQLFPNFFAFRADGRRTSAQRAVEAVEAFRIASPCDSLFRSTVVRALREINLVQSNDYPDEYTNRRLR